MLTYLSIITSRVEIEFITCEKFHIVYVYLGMILLTELSRRRIRSINKLIRVGRNEVVVVVRVDRDKGLIKMNTRSSFSIYYRLY